MSTPTVRLNNAVEIPQLGFGTWQIPPDESEARVREALDCGYRHIDTAQIYENEAGVGKAIAACGLARDEIFVTTKLHNRNHNRVVAAAEDSLRELGLEKVDLFLIHWPLPTTEFDYVQTWLGMQEVLERGYARAIGTSNFKAAHLDRVLAVADVVPAVNQVEIHPYFPQNELRHKHQELGIATEAWSPLAQGQVFADPRLQQLAEQSGRPISQLVLRWALERGDIIFPKASAPDRMAENFDIFDWELTTDQRDSIDALDENRRTGPDPDEFDWIGD